MAVRQKAAIRLRAKRGPMTAPRASSRHRSIVAKILINCYNSCQTGRVRRHKYRLRSATAPQSNLNISQIVPAIVAFWTDSKCEVRLQ